MNLNKENKAILVVYGLLVAFGIYQLFVLKEANGIRIPMIAFPVVLMAYYCQNKEGFIPKNILRIVMYFMLVILVVSALDMMVGLGDGFTYVLFQTLVILSNFLFLFYLILVIESIQENYKYIFFHIMMYLVSLLIMWLISVSWAIGTIYIAFIFLGIGTLYSVFYKYDI